MINTIMFLIIMIIINIKKLITFIIIIFIIDITINDFIKIINIIKIIKLKKIIFQTDKNMLVINITYINNEIKIIIRIIITYIIPII